MQHSSQDKNQNSRLVLAIGLSVAILVGFHYAVEKPRLEKLRAQQQLISQTQAVAEKKAQEEIVQTTQDRTAAIATSPRLKIISDHLQGSINLKGGRLDDLTLQTYKDKLGPEGKPVTLLSPSNAAAPAQPYYASWGWLGDNVTLPNHDTVWTTSATQLGPNQNVLLTWENSQGLVFEREIALDDKYMFTLTERVKNKSAQNITLYPFGLIQRQGPSADQGYGVIHIGLHGVFDGKLTEKSFDDVRKQKQITMTSQGGGWLGITDKYWLVGFAPGANQAFTGQFRFDVKANQPENLGRYQVDFRSNPVQVGAGTEASVTYHLFAGAKEVNLLNTYQDKFSIASFDKAIDFGWFYFLTKPLLILLDWLYRTLGNAGVAIIILTLLTKIITLPLTIKSSQSMARLKELQPEVQALMERYKDDYTQRSMQVMELYKREKVSPFSGCLPILLQIPIFFALYKILLIGIEMRHAPFFGWIHDLSAPDPTSIFNLFGLLPYDVPSFLHIGIWPVLMGISMYWQQKMTPTPSADKMQQQIMLMMPLIFTFLLAPSMSAGLIIYWTVSNILTVLQQWVIGRFFTPAGQAAKAITKK